MRAAISFRSVIEESAASGRLAIRYADAELDAKAWDVMERYSDRVLSFTDCVSAVIAREAAAAAVFGLDADFSVLGFALEP